MRCARTAVTALVATSTLGVVAAAPVTAVDAPTELLISEYIEGSSNNKAIEIYNGTGAPVDLSTYTLSVYFNGSTSAQTNVALSGTVASGGVFVIADDDAAAEILAEADQQATSSLWNGDDAIVLTNGGIAVDSIGQVGFDPGSQWGSGDVSNADNTLRRIADVCGGDTNPADAFDPTIEWDGFATNTFDGLGSHTADCGGDKPPVINEFSANTTGSNDVEYVEIHAAAATDLSGHAVLQIEGDGAGAGVVDGIFPVGTTDNEGLFLVDLPSGTLENGTITLLLVEGSSGVIGDDLDSNNDGTFDVTPWSEIVDSVGVTGGGSVDLAYSNVVLGPNYDGVAFTPGGASRIPHGIDTDTAADWVRNDFDLFGIDGQSGSPQLGEAVNTPGAPNRVVELADTPASSLDIWEVQGSGFASPYDGQRVIIDGYVVGDFQAGGSFGGFYLQEPNETSDLDPATSDGIFVFSTAVDVGSGDFVTVTGTVDEFFGRTGVTSVESIVVSDSDSTVPAPTPFALPAANEAREAVEGMLVTIPETVVISEYFNFDRFGEIVLTSDRQNQPTAIVEPGPDAQALAAEQALNRIMLDDGLDLQNPAFTRHPNGEEFTLANRFRGGDTLTNVVGVMDYAFGNYKIQPTAGADYTVGNPRPTSAPDVGGTMKVASFNVLNYFNTLDQGPDACGPANNQECRGADNVEERERQLAKIVAAMAAIEADVFGINEVENSTGVEAMADIVDGLNAIFGPGSYAYVDTGTIGTDAIKVGFIYRTEAAVPVGDHAILDSDVDPRFIDTKSRPTLAHTFFDTSTGRHITLAVNHLKSKGSDCNALNDPDTGDGQGNCNLTRTAAAEALADWLAGNPTGFDAPTMIIGDLNSYDMEDPIDALKAAGYTDLIFEWSGAEAYSFVFDGKVGYLDHALADSTLVGSVTGAAEWHINADEPDIVDYDTSFKKPVQDALYEPNEFRSSDHDPVIVGVGQQLDAEILITWVADQVELLGESGSLNGGQTNALLRSLDRAATQLDGGHDIGARGILMGVASQLRDFVDDGILTSQDAAPLLHAVDSIVDALS